MPGSMRVDRGMVREIRSRTSPHHCQLTGYDYWRQRSSGGDQRCDDWCCWPWSAWPRSWWTARSAWGTASRRPRCSSPRASARPRRPRRSTSPSSAPHWSPGSPTTRSATPTGARWACSRVPGFVGAFAGATLLVNLDADLAVPVVAAILVVLGTYVTWRFLAPRRLPVRSPSGGPLPRPARSVRRRPGRGRRRRLGPGRHLVAAGVRPARAAQGGRLGRHRGVRGRGRRLARLPGRPRDPGHPLGVRRRADGRRGACRAGRRRAGPATCRRGCSAWRQAG